MKQIGGLMALFGVAATVMSFMNSVPRVLSWIYNWGETTAWIIKIGLIVVGAVLYFMGNSKEASEDASE